MPLKASLSTLLVFALRLRKGSLKPNATTIATTSTITMVTRPYRRHQPSSRVARPRRQTDAGCIPPPSPQPQAISDAYYYYYYYYYY